MELDKACSEGFFCLRGIQIGLCRYRTGEFLCEMLKVGVDCVVSWSLA